MNQKSHDLEAEIRSKFDQNDTNYAQNGIGAFERMEKRIEHLERAVSHLTAFISDRFRLEDCEINDEEGLTDW